MGKGRGHAAVTCKGLMIRHKDGSRLWCSEEMEGRACGDGGSGRHRIVESCSSAFDRGCPKCDERVSQWMIEGRHKALAGAAR